MLELPTNRADYVGVLQDIGDYPARSPIGHRIPSDQEVAELKRQQGRWRAIVLLEDERALKIAGWLFNRVFVLDPFYDSGALLYAAWHDPLIKDEHARRLAEQTSQTASSLDGNGITDAATLPLALSAANRVRMRSSAQRRFTAVGRATRSPS